ncbi:MAG TPA: NAD(P)/FAD-dependent oxidoreductase [Thermoanaerobaculia bacterium]|nr:NAD(P)/FAD-dependent oxidoreductase [Thermoanaerobaculia bacterium]
MSTLGPRERFDVVIVGARCAGSPLATFLRRAGLSVCVVDQTDFPSDTLSTHMFQVSGIKILQQLGVVEKVLASGAPPITECYMKFEDVDLSGPPRLRPGDPPLPMLCVRRIALDVHLVAAAREAGVAMRLHSRVTGLVESNGRVAGVRVAGRDGKTSTIEADLVVGADGRSSTVARLAGARSYHVVPSERLSSWAYFRGVPRQAVARVFYHRRGDEFVVAAPADDDLYIAIVCPSSEHLDSYLADREGWFKDTVAGCAPVAELLAGAERVTKFRGLMRFEGYFREAAGPGWVLAGDAGHFKDPTPGQGISDALRQVEKLAAAILRGFGNPRARDAELRAWWRWRDADAIQHYWFAADIGKRGAISPVQLEILRGIAADEERRQDFLDIFLHRMLPRELFGLGTLTAAASRMLLDPRRRSGALAGAARLCREEIGRRWQALRPRFAAPAAADPSWRRSQDEALHSSTAAAQ